VPHEEWAVEEFTQLSPEKYKLTTHMDRAPEVARYWARADPNYRDGEGAESFIDFMQRVHAALVRASEHPHKSILMFTHGHFIRGVLWHLLFAPDVYAPLAFKRFSEGIDVPNLATFKVEQRWTAGRVR
jgi:probable phosphoglycerate mutase